MPRIEVAVQIGTWDELQAAAATIRFAVFVDEQKVPAAIELDEWDLPSLHALARDAQGRAVGTGRLLPDGHIGRMAVLASARGMGVGSALLTALIEAARVRGHAEVLLSAQTHAIPFYRRHGFAEEGEPYDDAGIPHVLMRRRLTV
jgi:predicted GNAT family N-acyltransferase